jgi:hypothetical protein
LLTLLVRQHFDHQNLLARYLFEQGGLLLLLGQQLDQ